MNIHRSVYLSLITLLFFSISVITTEIASAQSDTTMGPAHFHPGTWGLQFSVLNNFTLGSFQGGLISVQYHLSNSNAIRVGADLNLSVSDANTVSASRNDTLDVTRLSSGSSDGQDGGLTLQFVSYVNPDRDIMAYWGVGPTVRYSRNHSNSTTSAANPQSFSTSVSTTNIWYLGGALIGGGEWFITNSFALHAEYGLSFTYSWYSQTTGGTSMQSSSPIATSSTYDRHADGWALTSKNVRLGLSVYF